MRRVEAGVATGDGALASHLKTRWLLKLLSSIWTEKRLFHGGIESLAITMNTQKKKKKLYYVIYV